MEATVDTVPTPNPDALMFKVQEVLVPTGTYEFKGRPQASSSPLARRLFDITGVLSVLVAPRFVTVAKEEEEVWPMLVPQIKAAIRDFLDSGDMAVEEKDAPVYQTDDPLEKQVIALLDEFIRPAVAQDGGDIIYQGMEDGYVLVHLIGSCSTCPSSTATLFMGVERMLLEELPELKGVRRVEM
jgi:Fe-S cluster biogenesis protein NfuA